VDGIGLAVFQQFVGINVVFYYGATLWQAVGFSEGDALQINIISGVVSIGAVWPRCCWSTGRKPLLLIGSAGMAVTLGMAWAFSTATQGADGGRCRAPWPDRAVGGQCLCLFFNMSWGPIMWVMLGEMFPNQIRGSGLAVSGLRKWIANAAISVSFPRWWCRRVGGRLCGLCFGGGGFLLCPRHGARDEGGQFGQMKG
jgi:SP family sugar:H+ symporter-like MFS transporter